MILKTTNNQAIWLLIWGLAAMLVITIQANAQTNSQFIFNWKSDSYTPSFYQGKVLPIPGSNVTASFEFIKNGNLVDLHNQIIQWTVNGRLTAVKKGMQEIAFKVPSNFLGEKLVINVIIRDLGINQVFTIPISSPSLVIERKGDDLFVLPFFFNITDPQELELNWSEGETIINVTAQNKNNPLERARAVKNI